MTPVLPFDDGVIGEGVKVQGGIDFDSSTFNGIQTNWASTTTDFPFGFPLDVNQNTGIMDLPFPQEYGSFSHSGNNNSTSRLVTVRQGGITIFQDTNPALVANFESIITWTGVLEERVVGDECQERRIYTHVFSYDGTEILNYQQNIWKAGNLCHCTIFATIRMVNSVNNVPGNEITVTFNTL